MTSPENGEQRPEKATQNDIRIVCGAGPLSAPLATPMRVSLPPPPLSLSLSFSFPLLFFFFCASLSRSAYTSSVLNVVGAQRRRRERSSCVFTFFYRMCLCVVFVREIDAETGGELSRPSRSPERHSRPPPPEGQVLRRGK